MIDIAAHMISTDHRAGRMLRAMVTAGNKNAKMLLTTDLHGLDGSTRYHQTFAVKRWTGRDGATMLSIEVEGSGDWNSGVKPIKVMHVNVGAGRILPANDHRNADAVLKYAAEAALAYAWLGEAGLPKPTNGTVTVLESDHCSCCGRTLTDPESIARGIGPECYGRTTGTTTIMGRNRATAAVA